MKVLKRQNRLFSRDPSTLTCAVVGNSRSMLGSDLGEKIDSHNCVLRFNTAPTEGYEKDVGSRTTARVINWGIMQGNGIDYSDHTPRNWLAKQSGGHYICKPAKIPEYAERASFIASSSCELYVLKEEFKNKYFAELQSKFEKCQPSTGLYGVWLANYLFDDIRVYGMDGYQGEYVHYYEDMKRSDNPDAHDWKKDITEIIKILKE